MYYLGIDIGKYFHQAYVCTADGKDIIKSFSFTNTVKGYKKFDQKLAEHINQEELKRLHKTLLVLTLV